MSPAAPHVLVVEDEPVISSLLAEVLGSAGYRVTTCARVDEAVTAARQFHDLALCISDFLLPDRTGLDLAKELRKLRPGLKMVLCSAFLEPDVEAQVQTEPAVVLIVRKPIDIFDLKARVDALTGRPADAADGEQEREAPGSC
jgi:CheY-like chemotaxis protein